MDGLALLFGILAALFVLAVLGMNYTNISIFNTKKEGFENIAAAAASTSNPSKEIELQVRTILDKMAVPEVCPLFTVIRSTMLKNEKAGTEISDAEANARVEKNLAAKIPGGALSCPLLTYPRPGAKPLDWLDFVSNSVPTDFGARVVFMGIFAKEYLGEQETQLKAALGGNIPMTGGQSEGFSMICPPDVAASRRAAALAKNTESCVLPENLSEEDIRESITERLKELVAKKTTILKAKGVDPGLDIRPLLKEAEASAAYLKKKTEETEAGTIKMDAPAAGL